MILSKMRNEKGGADKNDKYKWQLCGQSPAKEEIVHRGPYGAGEASRTGHQENGELLQPDFICILWIVRKKHSKIHNLRKPFSVLRLD